MSRSSDLYHSRSSWLTYLQVATPCWQQTSSSGTVARGKHSDVLCYPPIWRTVGLIKICTKKGKDSHPLRNWLWNLVAMEVMSSSFWMCWLNFLIGEGECFILQEWKRHLHALSINAVSPLFSFILLSHFTFPLNYSSVPLDCATIDCFCFGCFSSWSIYCR